MIGIENIKLSGRDKPGFWGVTKFYNFSTGEEQAFPCIVGINAEGDIEPAFSEKIRKEIVQLLLTGCWYLLEVGLPDKRD